MRRSSCRGFSGGVRGHRKGFESEEWKELAHGSSCIQPAGGNKKGGLDLESNRIAMLGPDVSYDQHIVCPRNKPKHLTFQKNLRAISRRISDSKKEKNN